VIVGSISPLCNNYWRYFFCIAILFFSWAYWLKEGAPSLEEEVSWKVLSGGLTPNLFHLSSTSPDIHFDSISIDFGGHLQGGRNLSLLQPERAHFARGDNTSQLENELILGDLLYSYWRDIGGLYIHLSIVFQRHYQPLSSFFYMYSISALLLYEVSYILK
jgi:hypothetical protein